MYLHLIGAALEVGIPRRVDTLGVVGPRLVHLLNVGTGGARQVALLGGGLRRWGRRRCRKATLDRRCGA